MKVITFICFYHSINVRENVFFLREGERERDQDLDTKKEQALFITFSQSDCFIAQNDPLWFAITTRNSSHKNSESREATVKLNVYSRT